MNYIHMHSVSFEDFFAVRFQELWFLKNLGSMRPIQSPFSRIYHYRNNPIDDAW